MTIFEQRRRAYRQRLVDHLKQGEEILDKALRQTSAQKRFQYLLVRSVGKSYWIQIVALHKLVEDISAYYHSARYRERYAVEVVTHRIFLDNRVDESQTAALAAKRPLPYAGEIGIMVKPVLSEYSHHAAVFHLTVFHYQIEKQLAHGRGFLYALEAVPLDYLGDRKQGSRIEPARYIVVARMIEERLGRDVKYMMLQVLEVVDTEYLFARLRITDYEVAESEVSHYGATKVDRKFL